MLLLLNCMIILHIVHKTALKFKTILTEIVTGEVVGPNENLDSPSLLSGPWKVLTDR